MSATLVADLQSFHLNTFITVVGQVKCVVLITTEHPPQGTAISTTYADILCNSRKQAATTCPASAEREAY